jgi:signal transduction histidine kinase
VIPAVSAIHRGVDGTLWIGTAQGVWKRASNGEVQKLPELPEIVRNQQVHALTVDAAGDLWVSPERDILYRLRKGAWEPFGNLAGLPRQSALAQTLGSDGRMWFGYADGSVAVTQGDDVKLYTSSDGLAPRQVSSISVTREILVGGEDGVVVFHEGRFHRLIVDDAMTLEGLTGLLQTQDGDVWLNSLRGAVRIDGQNLQRALQNGTYAVPLETFDGNDGYPGTAQQARPKPTLSQGSDGRLWFSGTLGAGWLDPDRIHRNTVPPPVHIRSVITNDKPYAVGSSVELPKGTRDLQVSYTALSLARPEHVRFRYRLEGYERAWTDAGGRREAYFTNLPPGDYRFRVIAANESGMWNDAGASVSITLPPTFTQTRVFLGLCAIAGIAALWGAYVVRIRQVTARERGRLQERLSERLRIARELHDTLLQGVQGLILQFQAIANQGDMREQTRQTINDALDRADALLVEGRDRVKDLRSATVLPLSLRQQLLEAVEHMSEEQRAKLRVIENGTLRDLYPMVREEVVRITSEAIINALRHAAAATIEIEVSYERARLRINVRDDGRGMDESMIRAGREGHFGLLGMQERTKRIRGQIKIWSRPGAGTEVSLTVPASMAYVRRRWTQAAQVVSPSPP